MLASRPPVGKQPGGTAGGTQHQQELPDRGDEDGPARPGKGRGRGRRRPGKRQRETASANQDHDQDWRRGRWGRQADYGGADHNDRGTGGRGQWKWQQMIRDASGAKRLRTGARHGPAGAATRAGTRAGTKATTGAARDSAGPLRRHWGGAGDPGAHPRQAPGGVCVGNRRGLHQAHQGQASVAPASRTTPRRWRRR